MEKNIMPQLLFIAYGKASFPRPNLISVTDNTTATANEDIKDMLQRAYDNGIPSNSNENLRLLVLEYEQTLNT